LLARRTANCAGCGRVGFPLLLAHSRFFSLFLGSGVADRAPRSYPLLADRFNYVRPPRFANVLGAATTFHARVLARRNPRIRTTAERRDCHGLIEFRSEDKSNVFCRHASARNYCSGASAIFDPALTRLFAVRSGDDPRMSNEIYQTRNPGGRIIAPAILASSKRIRIIVRYL